MSAVDDVKKDALKLSGLSYAKPVGIGLLIVCGLFLANQCGRRSVVVDQTLKARTDTVRIAEQARAVAAETVTVRLKAQARIDTLVKVVSDTQLTVAHDTIVSPQLVVERIVTDDKSIAALTHLVAADSTDIRALHLLLATPKPRAHWGLGVGVGYACNQKGCGPGIGLGLTWRF